MKKLVQKLLHNESGSAITEFVMGLPVFIMIFSGMGMLYRFNQEALVVKAEAYRELWQNDSEIDLLGMTPITGALSSIGSVTDVWNNGLSGGGIYIDSGVKAQIPATLMPGSGISPQRTLSGITGGDDNMINYRLLNDLMDPTFEGGSFASAFSSIVRTTGSGLAIGAGIRYGASEGEATRSGSHTWGDYNYESGQLQVPARTVATHRIAPVVMTRLEFTNTERFDNSIPVFEINPNLDDEELSEGDACQAQSQAYQNCLNANPDDSGACDGSKPSEECGEIGGNGPLGNFDTSWCGALGGC